MLVFFSAIGVYVLHDYQFFVAARFYINLFYPPVILFIIVQIPLAEEAVSLLSSH